MLKDESLRRRLNRFKRPSFPFQASLYFIEGLHGFESHTEFLLFEKDVPFLRLESKADSRVSFVVIDPFVMCPNYLPKISRFDLKQLNVLDESELILLAIVNTSKKPYTANLAAPILIHWDEKKGKQILLQEDPAYPID